MKTTKIQILTGLIFWAKAYSKVFEHEDWKDQIQEYKKN